MLSKPWARRLVGSTPSSFVTHRYGDATSMCGVLMSRSKTPKQAAQEARHAHDRMGVALEVAEIDVEAVMQQIEAMNVLSRRCEHALLGAQAASLLAISARESTSAMAWACTARVQQSGSHSIRHDQRASVWLRACTEITAAGNRGQSRIRCSTPDGRTSGLGHCSDPDCNIADIHELCLLDQETQCGADVLDPVMDAFPMNAVPVCAIAVGAPVVDTPVVDTPPRMTVPAVDVDRGESCRVCGCAVELVGGCLTQTCVNGHACKRCWICFRLLPLAASYVCSVCGAGACAAHDDLPRLGILCAISPPGICVGCGATLALNKRKLDSHVSCKRP